MNTLAAADSHPRVKLRVHNGASHLALQNILLTIDCSDRERYVSRDVIWVYLILLGGLLS